MKKAGAAFFLFITCQVISNDVRANDSRSNPERHWFYMVQTNSTDPAREAEFNTWYDDIDIPDVLAVPGFMRARRGLGQKLPEFPSVDLKEGQGKYVALYDIETEDIDKSIIDLYVAARKMGALGRLTDLLKVTEASYYQRLRPTHEVVNTKPAAKNKYIYVQEILCCRDEAAKAQFRDWYDKTYIPAIEKVSGFLRVNLYELYRVMTVLSVGPEEIPHLLAVYEIKAESAKQAVQGLSGAADTLNEAGRMSELYVAGDATAYLEMSDVNSEDIQTEAADSVFRNGQIYTVNQSQPWGQAMAVKDGRIVAVGDDVAVASYVGPKTRVIDLDGKFVMPGLHDAHLHMQLVADLQFNLRMDAYQPWEKIVQAISEYAQAHPDRSWIYGASLPWLSETIGDFVDVPAHKSTLDKIVADRPVAISDIGGHAMLVNSKALEMAGITDDTPNPIGGTIERDANGEATGVLRELAIHLVKESMDGLSVEQYQSGLPQVIAQLNTVGITSVNEVWAHTNALQALKLLDDANGLNLRVTAAITHPADFVTPAAKENARKTIEARERYRGKRVKPDYVKFLLWCGQPNRGDD